MLTVSQVASSSPSRWSEAEEAHARMSKDLNEAAEGLYDRAGGALKEAFWSDAHGDRARVRLSELAYTTTAMLLRAACSLLSGLDLSLGTCRNRLLRLLSQTNSYGLPVTEDGYVDLWVGTSVPIVQTSSRPSEASRSRSRTSWPMRHGSMRRPPGPSGIHG